MTKQKETPLKPKPLCLIILDGFGTAEAGEHNAISQANTPTLDELFKTAPHTLLDASGESVGLPHAQMGNSEVGHMHIGAGRAVPQDLTRIQQAIADHSFEQNPVLCDVIDQTIQNNHSLHVLGLLSPGGVHSHESQIQALLAMAKQRGCTKLYLHAFLDGRDTPPKSANASLQAIIDQGTARIASICGRYYAMDRDQRFERIESTYHLLTQGHGQGIHYADTAMHALQMAYDRGETDEFVQATTIHPQGESPHCIQDGDGVIFMNFRADRARQLTQALTDPNFEGFQRTVFPNTQLVTLTQYQAGLHASIAFPPLNLHNTLGECIAKQGLTQLRLAETEKYAHVTFFMNGGCEAPFDNEHRILIASPKVATYDEQPEMSARELTDVLVDTITEQQTDVVIVNYANPDMVGHTGNLPATIQAIETIDQCLARILAALEKTGGEMILTADHGNAECMFNSDTQQAHTAHTTEPVPFIYHGRPAMVSNEMGSLMDIAPTMLALLGIAQPPEMTGKNLVTLTEV